MCALDNNKRMNSKNSNQYLEVYLTTYEGSQHLRLHGWLKRNNIAIRSENILNEEDCFGVFTVIIEGDDLDNLKEENLEKSLFCDLETMDLEKGNASFTPHQEEEEEYDLKEEFRDDLQNIQELMVNFPIKDPGDIKNFLKQANETSLALFKRNDDFINDYVKTREMSKDDKLKDLEYMIEAFVPEERYEDCALLVKIKEKVIKYYEKTIIKK
tara:strand:- start:93 stop:731 length:639 start_codon:yes stop_codon:yes gene_type:complete